MQIESKMTAAEVTGFLDNVFPEMHHDGRLYKVAEIFPGGANLHLTFHERFRRPGGTISGPTMFTLADFGFYAAILGALGPVALAVTTNLNINFLRKPVAGDMTARVELIKLGKRLAVGEARLYSVTSPDMVAHATGTYSLPAQS